MLMDHYENEQAMLAEKIMVALTPYGIEPPQSVVKSFVNQLILCHINEARIRKFLQSRRQGITSPKMEIYNFLKDFRDSGRVDEALWCAFIAAHFGRTSANPDHPGEVESAGRFLCAFGYKPTWTWMYVSTNHNNFTDQLDAHDKDLETLRFGNHRKYCSKRPQQLARVIKDFVKWVNDHGGSPNTAFALPQGSTPRPGFSQLYRKFTVYSFGRTGHFDFLNLLSQTRLLNIQPDSCYLLGSTGPFNGAKLLCETHANRFSNQELSEIIDTLANRLGISYDVMEDALCIWQKEPIKQTAEQQPDFHDATFIPIQTIYRK